MIKKFIAPLLPDWLRSKISQRRNLYELQKNANQLSEVEEENLQFVEDAGDGILISGYIKSGNTWLRFLLFNYLHMLQFSRKETLTYDQLNSIQNGILETTPTFDLKTSLPMPLVLRTHSHYKHSYGRFSEVLYMHRHPLDTLVSSYYFNVQRDKPRLGQEFQHRILDKIDNYVLYHLPFWIFHLKSYRDSDKALMVSYESMKEKPLFELQRVISHCGIFFNPETAEKAIAASSFSNIKKMGRETKQSEGMGKKGFKGEFTRKGKIGGFKDELKPETICKAFSILKSNGLNYE